MTSKMSIQGQDYSFMSNLICPDYLTQLRKQISSRLKPSKALIQALKHSTFLNKQLKVQIQKLKEQLTIKKAKMNQLELRIIRNQLESDEGKKLTERLKNFQRVENSLKLQIQRLRNQNLLLKKEIRIIKERQIQQDQQCYQQDQSSEQAFQINVFSDGSLGQSKPFMNQIDLCESAKFKQYVNFQANQQKSPSTRPHITQPQVSVPHLQQMLFLQSSQIQITLITSQQQLCTSNHPYNRSVSSKFLTFGPQLLKSPQIIKHPQMYQTKFDQDQSVFLHISTNQSISENCLRAQYDPNIDQDMIMKQLKEISSQGNCDYLGLINDIQHTNQQQHTQQLLSCQQQTINVQKQQNLQKPQNKQQQQKQQSNINSTFSNQLIQINVVNDCYATNPLKTFNQLNLKKSYSQVIKPQHMNLVVKDLNKKQSQNILNKKPQNQSIFAHKNAQFPNSKYFKITQSFKTIDFQQQQAEPSLKQIQVQQKLRKKWLKDQSLRTIIFCSDEMNEQPTVSQPQSSLCQSINDSHLQKSGSNNSRLLKASKVISNNSKLMMFSNKRRSKTKSITPINIVKVGQDSEERSPGVKSYCGKTIKKRYSKRGMEIEQEMRLEEQHEHQCQQEYQYQHENQYQHEHQQESFQQQ